MTMPRGWLMICVVSCPIARFGARRTPPWEHGWRFCRRNPALAISGALVVSLLSVILIVWAGWTASLDAQLRHTADARRSERAARRDALEKLWRS